MTRYTTEEAGKLLGLDPSMIRRACRQGKLGDRIGRNFSITQAQLDRFIASRRTARKRQRRGRPIKTKGDK